MEKLEKNKKLFGCTKIDSYKINSHNLNNWILKNNM